MTWHIGACRDNATIRETKPAVKAEQTHTQCWADPGRAAGGLLVLGRSSTARRRNNEVVALLLLWRDCKAAPSRAPGGPAVSAEVHCPIWMMG